MEPGTPKAVIDAKVGAAVDNALSAAGINPADADTPVLTGTGGGRGNPATVELAMDYRFTFLGPLMGWTIGKSTLKLRTSITMRNE